MRIPFLFTACALVMASCADKANPADLSSPETVTNAIFQALADGDCEKMRLLVWEGAPPEGFYPARVAKKNAFYGPGNNGTCEFGDSDLCNKPNDVKILQEWASQGWSIHEVKPTDDPKWVDVTVIVEPNYGVKSVVYVGDDGLCYVAALE